MSEPTAKQIRRRYRALLNTSEWKEFRQDVTAYYGRCWLCGDEEALEVHHMRYEPNLLPWDYDLEAVRVYCRTCHETVTRCADDIWNECQALLPHELESVLKAITWKEFRALQKYQS